MVAITQIRNVVLVGQAGSGKTTLAEGLLFAAGLSPQWNKPQGGHFDFLEEEKERQASIATAIVQGRAGELLLSVIDTPGATDFMGEITAGLAAADTAIFVVGANQGIGVTTRKAKALADRIGLAQAVVITKVDAENVRLEETLAQVRKFFGQAAVPIVSADGTGAALTAVKDVRQVGGAALEALTEAVCSADEALMEKYFAAGALDQGDLNAGIRKAMTTRDLIPVFIAGSAKQIGAAELFAVIRDNFPTPADLCTATFAKGEDAVSVTPDGSLVARVFKSHLDAYVGRVNFIRVYGGTARKDALFLNPTTGKSEKLTQPQLITGAKLGENIEAAAGMIFGVAKCESLSAGASVLAPDRDGTLITTLSFPKPMVMLALEAENRKDADKLSAALRKQAESDPCLKLSREAQSGELVINGLTDLHLRLVLERIRKQEKIACLTKPPRVPYKETLTANATVRYRHKKQSGGSGEFGEVELKIGPADAEFVAEGEDTLQYYDELKGMNVDRVYVPSVEKGIRDVISKGILAGFPVINVKAVLVDGKQHDVDSKDRAFQVAGREAFRHGFLGEKHVPRDWNEPNRVSGDPKPVLLEPIVEMEVTVPSNLQGAILGDANKRRGQVIGQEPQGDMTTITIRVPLAEVLNYSSELQSMTAGEGFFTMEPLNYEQVPGNVQQEIIARARAERESK